MKLRCNSYYIKRSTRDAQLVEGNLNFVPTRTRKSRKRLFFYLIGNSSGMFLLNKTLRGDAHLSGYRTVNSSLGFELRSRSSAKELQATLCSLIGKFSVRRITY